MASPDDAEYVLGPNSNSTEHLQAVIDRAWDRLHEE
jgi:hypothetical protein